MDFLINIRNIKTALLFLLLFIFSNAFSQNSIEGVWKSEDGKYMMKIASIGDEVQGRIVWLQQETDKNGDQTMDVKNPDEKLRKLPVKGSKILKDLKHTSGNSWQGGTIYQPETGKSFKCNAEVKGDQLVLTYDAGGGSKKNWNWTRSR